MKALVCYNPKSGKQKVGKNLEYIKTKLKEKYEVVDVYTTTGEKSLIGYLKDNANKYDLLLVSGGDGTLNETVTGVIEGNASPKIAYIPGGTCNDVGSMLYLPKNIKKAMKIILSDQYELMDVCKADDKYFVYVFGAGKFIDISYKTPHKMKKRFGKLGYFLYGAKELTMKQKLRMKFEFDGQVVEGDYYVVLGLNSNHVSGFSIFRKPGIKLNDGLFDLTLIESKKFMTWPKLLGFVLFGDRIKRGIKTYRVSKVHIKTPEPIDFNVDGELAFCKNDCTIEILPKAVNIILPKKAIKRYF